MCAWPLSTGTALGFGIGDFALELTIAGLGMDPTTDGDKASLFIRSAQGSRPYTGPTGQVRDNSDIIFRMRADDALTCRGVLPNLSTLTPRRLRFERAKQTLSVRVDGKEVCSHTMKLVPETRLFDTAPLRFGGNHVASDGQNLAVRLSDIMIFTAAFPSTGEIPCPCVCTPGFK